MSNSDACRMLNCAMKRFFQMLIVMLSLILMSPAFAFGEKIVDAVDAYENGDYFSAFEIYSKFANEGDTFAQRNLGVMYENGHGVKQNDINAAFWYRKAADQGDIFAKRNLGWLYANGRGISNYDPKLAEKYRGIALGWYEEAAIQGDTLAQCFLEGFDKFKQEIHEYEKKLVECYRKSAEQGDGDAQRKLNEILEAKSLENKKLETQRIELQRLEAQRIEENKRRTEAQFQAGISHLTGRGVEQDFDAALRLFIQVAAQNDNPAFQAAIQLPAHRGILEKSLRMLQSNGKHRILSRGTYVIFLPDDKRMLHPYSGSFDTEPSIREGGTIAVQAHRETDTDTESGDDVSIQLTLTTDFLVRSVLLDEVPLLLLEVTAADDPRNIQTKTQAILIPAAQLNNGNSVLIKIVSREGHDHTQSLILRDGQLIVAAPAEAGLMQP